MERSCFVSNKSIQIPFPTKNKTVFDGRWDTFNNTVSLKTTDGGWYDRISYVEIPKD